CQHYYDTPYSF
nr:immunoglobulin light chain junction region [Macaca mulatta]